MEKFFSKKNVLISILCGILLIAGGIGIYVLFEPTFYRLFFSLLPPKPASAQERQLISLTNKHLTSKEYARFIGETMQIAKTARYTLVKNCSPYPAIQRVKKTDKVKFINVDKTIQIISFSGTSTIAVKPGKVFTVSLDFVKNTPRIIGYGCGNSPNPVGLILVLTP